MSRLALFALLSAALAAQATHDPIRFVPADACIVVRARGPAAWRQEFAATALGKVLTGEALAPQWRKARAALAGEDVLPEALRTRVLPVLEALHGHGGEIVLALRIDWSDLAGAIEDRRPPAFAALLAIGPADGTDLPELARGIGAALTNAVGGEPRTQRIAGESIEVLALPFGSVALPVMRDGCLLWLFGTDLATQAERFLAVPEGKGFPLEEANRGAAFAAQVESGPAIEQALAALPEGTLPAAVEPLLAIARLQSLRRLHFRVRADGTCIDSDIEGEFEAPRGVYDAVVPIRRIRPTLLQFLPDSAETWESGGFDPEALHALYATFFARAEAALPVTREEFEQKFTAATKMRLKEDLLDAFTGEYLRIDDPAAVVDLEAEVSAFDEKMDERLGDRCFVFGLRGGKQFDQALERALRARGLHAGRKSEDYAGVRLHGLKLLGSYQIEYAITEDLLLLGVGGREGTQRHLRSVLDAARKRADGKPARELPAAVTRRLEGLPADWSGLAVSSMMEQIDGLLANLGQLEAIAAEEALDLADHNLGWVATLVEVTRVVRPELQKHGLDHSVSASYSTADRYLIRLRW